MSFSKICEQDNQELQQAEIQNDNTLQKYEEFNKTITKNIFDDQDIKNYQQDKLNDPKITTIVHKTVKVLGKFSSQSRTSNIPVSKELKSRGRMKKCKDDVKKTIFSNELKINYNKELYNMAGVKYKRQSKSESSKSSSLKKCQIKRDQQHDKRYYQLNIEGKKIPRLDQQKTPQIKGKKNQKKITNNLSAKEIILNENPSSVKNFRIHKKYQDFKRGNKESQFHDDNRKMDLKRVESGLQLVRQNKLRNAQQCIYEKKFQKAAQTLNLLLKVDSDDLQTLFLLAQVCEKSNQIQISQKYLKLIAYNDTIHQKFSYIKFRVMALTKLGQYQEALQNIQKMQVLNRQSPKNEHKFILFQLRGQIMRKNQYFEDALTLYEQALQFSTQVQEVSKIIQFSKFIGQINFELKMYRKALQYFSRALMLENEQNSNKKQLQMKVDQCNQKIHQRQTKFQLKQTNKVLFEHKLEGPPKFLQIQKFDENIDQAQYLQAYKILITNQIGHSKKTDQMLKPIQDKKLTQLGIQLKQKGLYQQALNIFAYQNQMQPSLLSLEQSAKLYYKLGDLEKCYDACDNYIKLSNKQNYEIKAQKQSVNQRHLQISKGINNYLLKVKQLEMKSMTQSDLQEISVQRNYNIGQAIKLFQYFDEESLQNSLNSSEKIKALSVIAEESTISVMKKSQGFETQKLNQDIFSLKQFRQVLSIWKEKQFSIQTLQNVAAIAYNLVKSDKNDFSILPFHIIVSTLKMRNEGMNFLDIDKLISEKLQQLCKTYPPSQRSITKSELKQFQIDFSSKQRVDLFSNQSNLSNFKKIYKKIEELSIVASKQIQIMDQKCKEICKESNGFGYKSNLKLPIPSNEVTTNNQRSYCRIIEKILAKDLEKYKHNFFSRIDSAKKSKVKDLFWQLTQEWEKTINDILKQKNSRLQPVNCYVYDLMRGKCMFNTIQDIDSAAETFIEGDKKGEFKIIEIQNRLNNKTKDVVLKIQFQTIVGQLQLALDFESQKNEFNHSLYQLSRSPFGSFFSSFMWLTGFSNQNQKAKFVINQNLKWKMKRLEHLRKFVYEDKLILDFQAQRQRFAINSQFNCTHLVLDEFLATTNYVQGYLRTNTEKYIKIQETSQIKQNSSHISCESISSDLTWSLPNQNLKLILSEVKPLYQFRFIFSDYRKSFATDEQFYRMKIHVTGTNYFFALNSIKSKNHQNDKFQLQKKQEQPQFIIIRSQKYHEDYIQQSKVSNLKTKIAFPLQFKGSKLSSRQKLNPEVSQWDQNRNYSQQIDEAQTLQRQIGTIIKKKYFLNQ